MPYIDSFNVGNVAYDMRDKYAGLYTANAYSSSATYAVGDLVTYDGKLYKCNTAIQTAETWTPAHWTETTMAAETSEFETAVADKITLASTPFSGKTNIDTSARIISMSAGAAQDYKVYYSPIVEGAKYKIISHDTGGGYVYAFYVSEPVVNATAYDGTRYVSSDNEFIAPITGYVAFRSIQETTDEGIVNICAIDTVARGNIRMVASILPSMTAIGALVPNDFRIVNNKLYRITTNIAAGASLIPGTNCTETTITAILKTLLT